MRVVDGVIARIVSLHIDLAVVSIYRRRIIVTLIGK